MAASGDDCADSLGTFWQALTEEANRAFSLGDDDRARSLFAGAIDEAERLLELAQGEDARAIPLAPVLHTIAGHNAAALERRQSNRRATTALVVRAFERLVEIVECSTMPPSLRESCFASFGHVLVALVDDQGRPGSTPYFERAMTAWLSMRMDGVTMQDAPSPLVPAHERVFRRMAS